MKVLIVSASRLGSTEGIAARIAARLETHGLEAVDCPVVAVSKLETYDAFVIGSAVYAGHWLKEASEFIHGQAATLGHAPSGCSAADRSARWRPRWPRSSR